MHDTGDMVRGSERLHGGIDLGSTGIKMLVIDDDGIEVAGAQVPTPWRVGEAGTTDIDADDLLAALRTLIGPRRRRARAADLDSAHLSRGSPAWARPAS